MKRMLLMLLMGLSVVSSAITGGTTASFTSAAQSTGNTFTAGTMVISSTPTSAVVTLTNMMPGGSIKGDLTVSNAPADSVNFTYAMSVDAADADLKSLRTALQLKVESGTCLAPTVTIYDGVLYDPAPGAVVFGDPNLAPRNKRFLASTTSEQLCLTIYLPGSTAGNVLQTATTTATITLSAVQA